MKHLLGGLMLLVTICIAPEVGAANFSVKASLDSTFLFIGEQAELTFEVKQPQNIKIHVPVFSDSIVSGIELVERKKPDTLCEQSQLVVRHTYVITSFDTALYYIPPFHFADESGDTIDSNPLSLKIFTVAIDSAQFVPADIKPVFKPPFDWKGTLLIFICILIVLLIAFAIYLIILRYKQNKPIINLGKNEPKRPAFEIAIESLNKIKEQKIWQKGEIKRYYTELTDVIRIYIGKNYALNAMESTSDEILSMLKPLISEKETLTLLSDLLALADLVKFAKWNPLPDDFTHSLIDAYQFVEKTKPQTETASEQNADSTPETPQTKDNTNHQNVSL